MPMIDIYATTGAFPDIAGLAQAAAALDRDKQLALTRVLAAPTADETLRTGAANERFTDHIRRRLRRL